MDDLVERALPHSKRVSLVREPDQDSSQSGTRSRVPTSLTFFVPGKPVPKGSKTIYRGRLVEGAKGYPDWAESVRGCAVGELMIRKWRSNHGTLYLGAPVTVLLDFSMPRPNRPKHQRHITKPDLDKLARGVLDPLTGVLWNDDSQVDKLIVSKHYDETVGVRVVVVG